MTPTGPGRRHHPWRPTGPPDTGRPEPPADPTRVQPVVRAPGAPRCSGPFEVGAEDARQFDGLVALDAVAGIGDRDGPVCRTPSVEFRLVGVIGLA